MKDKLDDSAPFNDDQGTRVSEPTGAGAEATQSTDGKARGRSHEHRSAYGGDAGEPKEPNRAPDVPKSRR